MQRREIDLAADDIVQLADEFAEKRRTALLDALTSITVDPNRYV